MENQTEQIVLNLNYWDCECETDYINSKYVKTCPKCGANQEEMPNSRVNEINDMQTEAKATYPYEIFCGAKDTMEAIARDGATGLNPKTHKYQVIDKNATYKVVPDGVCFSLYSDKDLKTTAKEKGLISFTY